LFTYSDKASYEDAIKRAAESVEVDACPFSSATLLDLLNAFGEEEDLPVATAVPFAEAA